MEHQPREVKEGALTYVNVGEVIRIERIQETFTVKESCDISNGYWYCVSHDETFASNLMLHGHTHYYPGSKVSHRIAWMCFEHGLEKP